MNLAEMSCALGFVAMRMKAFVIHLERASGRRPQAEFLRATLPPPAELLPAVDGLQLSDADVRGVFRPALHRPHYPFTLSRTEVACFLSHRRAWQAIVEEDLDAALVVEDDVAIEEQAFGEVLAAALDGLVPEEFVRFPFRDRGEQGQVVRAAGSARLIEPRMPGLNMQMQLVGREAARRLLWASEIFDRPVDTYVQMRWLHGVRVLTARPIVIREIGADLGGSVIHARRPGLVHKVVHEVRRPFIRLAMHRANERWRRRAA